MRALDDGIPNRCMGDEIDSDAHRLAGREDLRLVAVLVQQLDGNDLRFLRAPSLAKLVLPVGDDRLVAGSGVGVDDLDDGPINRTSPRSSHSASSQSCSTWPVAWLTRMIVRPSLRNSSIFSAHLRWNETSPTASTSSMSRISGSTLAAMAKPRRTVIPDE